MKIVNFQYEDFLKFAIYVCIFFTLKDVSLSNSITMIYLDFHVTDTTVC